MSLYSLPNAYLRRVFQRARGIIGLDHLTDEVRARLVVLPDPETAEGLTKPVLSLKDGELAWVEGAEGA